MNTQDKKEEDVEELYKFMNFDMKPDSTNMWINFSLLSISGSLRRFTYSVSANRYPTVVSNTFARFLATSIEGFISLRSYLEIPETEVCSFN